MHEWNNTGICTFYHRKLSWYSRDLRSIHVFIGSCRVSKAISPVKVPNRNTNGLCTNASIIGDPPFDCFCPLSILSDPFDCWRDPRWIPASLCTCPWPRGLPLVDILPPLARLLIFIFVKSCRISMDQSSVNWLGNVETLIIRAKNNLLICQQIHAHEQNVHTPHASTLDIREEIVSVYIIRPGVK